VLVEPAAVSVPVTLTDVQPGALAVNVAAPVPDEFAATVTGCGRFQLLDDSVMELPAVMDSPLFPELATDTVIGVVGDAVSDTPNTSLVPWATENVAGSACSARPELHEPPPPVLVDVGDAVGVGDEVGEEVGLLLAVGVGLGEEVTPVPLQVVPLMLKAVGAVLVPL
jgi:hypothetical protein